jgi:glycosyltransferase involved in cell wall biosynthesis
VSAREVPAFRAEVYGARRHPYCCLIFVINEGERLLGQLDRMAPLRNLVDIVVADGGSTDGSISQAELAPRGVRAALVKTGPGRLSAQMRMAFAWALDEGYRGVITVDGNGKDDTGAMPAFVAALDAGADHVQGSRFVPGGRAVRTPWGRYLGIRLLHAPLISLAARHRYTDTTNGFRAYSARFLADARVAPFRDVFSAYELHYYLAIRAARLGFRVLELPVTRTYPAHGPTPTKIHGWRGNVFVLRTLVAACLGRFNPARDAGRTEARP